MSAILSADTLNDFISPGVACIKPVETLPKQNPTTADATNPYEVTTEDKLAANGGGDAPTNAQISLTDCLACSGCVTSAEAILVSLQSHQEVLNTLDRYPSLSWQEARNAQQEGMVFVASVSPQTRANIAAAYQVSERAAGYMIEDLLRGPRGLPSTGAHKSGFAWVLDTNTARDLCLEAGEREVWDVWQRAKAGGAGHNAAATPQKPVLASACPGWICYAEKTHPHILPHLSRLKSPQAMMGTLVKTTLSQQFRVPPDKIWHVAIMPCFDKKLEASREELTDAWWKPGSGEARGVRDVDCVITGRELVMLADSRGIAMPKLAQGPLEVPQPKFPDAVLNDVLFPSRRDRCRPLKQVPEAGPSGGYALHMLEALQRQLQLPKARIDIERGRRADVVEYVLYGEKLVNGQVQEVVEARTARYYGFRNIQNLVRGLKPLRKSHLPGSAKPLGPRAGGVADYAYVEVMACPGGCTNGGGQIKASDVAEVRGLAAATAAAATAAAPGPKVGLAEQKAWLAQVDEAYYSGDGSSSDEPDGDHDGAGGSSARHRARGSSRSIGNVDQVLAHWSEITHIATEQLVLTSYRQVESDVGKAAKASDVERVAGLASSLGGGW